jgi:hypothetical protein
LKRKNPHPSAYELESWTVGDQIASVETHIETCPECRNTVDSLEIDRQTFIEEESPEDFLKRPLIAKVIFEQIRENKKRRKVESRKVLSDSLPYDTDKPTESGAGSEDNIISVGPRFLRIGGLLAAAAAAVYCFLQWID